MNCDNKDEITEIRKDISLIKENLGEHMARTKASEDRLAMVENRFFDGQDKAYTRFMEMDKANKAFTYKVLIGAIVAGLLPFLLKILGL